MNDKQINNLIKYFYGISTIMVLVGAYFKIQHYSNGWLLLIVGFIIGSITTSFELTRLKKRNKYLEDKLKEKE